MEDLTRQLNVAQTLGFLGPGAVEDHVVHAGCFLGELLAVFGRVIDLGSGGGVPGLVVATNRPDLEVILVDAAAKRCAFLERAVTALGLERTSVVLGRAEVVGRGVLRGSADAVIVRSFGPPAVTAECAAPLLRVGGRLIVSEPPHGPSRWPADPLRQLGLAVGHRSAGAPAVQVLVQETACPEQYPRRDGVPGKRPLF